MGSLGWPEIMVVLVIALIVFGPRKLPELGKTLGQSLAQFKRASEDFKRTWESEVETEKRRLDSYQPVEPQPDYSGTHEAVTAPAGEGASAAEGASVGEPAIENDMEHSDAAPVATEPAAAVQPEAAATASESGVGKTKQDWA